MNFASGDRTSIGFQFCWTVTQRLVSAFFVLLPRRATFTFIFIFCFYLQLRVFQLGFFLL